MTFDLDSVRSRLPGREIDWFETIDSTMLEAARTGRIVGAEEQTAGRGRHGRTWHSPKGAGLYVSMALHNVAGPVVTLALGLAAREAILRTTGLTPDLRWPNDVLLRGDKCAGILVQASLWGRPPACGGLSGRLLQQDPGGPGDRRRPGACPTGDTIIAGIGINVHQTEFPAGLDTPATSLLLEGAHIAREDLLVALVHAVDDSCRILAEDGPDAIMRQFAEASSYASGRRVRAEAAGRSIEGVTRGLNSSGFLIVREDNGAETTILAGGVRPA